MNSSVPAAMIGTRRRGTQLGHLRAPYSEFVNDSAALALTTVPDGDFQLRARVRVEHHASWDAGTVVLWADATHWAKLCCELSPQGQPSIMSVVTRSVSDDAVGWPIGTPWVWLRLTRRDSGYFFHARDDGGESWRLVRQFAMDTTEPVRAGIGIQSPVGDGCTAEFDRISLTATRLDDQFDGG